MKTEKNETHRHSLHTICDSVSGVTEEGYHPGVSVCFVSGTGNAVREVEGVFSVFFIVACIMHMYENNLDCSAGVAQYSRQVRRLGGNMR
jgi:hypothetical protein